MQNDKEGMQAVVDWLNYTPKDFHSIAPHILNVADPPSRKGKYHLIYLLTSEETMLHYVMWNEAANMSNTM